MILALLHSFAVASGIHAPFLKCFQWDAGQAAPGILSSTGLWSLASQAITPLKQLTETSVLLYASTFSRSIGNRQTDGPMLILNRWMLLTCRSWDTPKSCTQGHALMNSLAGLRSYILIKEPLSEVFHGFKRFLGSLSSPVRGSSPDPNCKLWSPRRQF